MKTLTKVRYLYGVGRRLGLKWKHLIIPLSLALISSVLEGGSVALLIQLVNGMINLDMQSVKTAPVIEHIYTWFPQFFGSNSSIFSLLLALVFFVTLSKLATQTMAAISAVYVIRKLANNIRQKIFRRYIHSSKLFFDRYSQGALHHSIMGNTGQIVTSFAEIQDVFIQLCMLMVYGFVLLGISFRITIMTAIAFPLIYLSTKWIIDRLRQSSMELAVTNRKMSEKIINVLSCIPLVKAYNQEDQEMHHFMHVSHKIARKEITVAKQRAYIVPIQEIVMLLLTIFLISFMALQIAATGNRELVAGFMVYFYVLKRAGASFAALNKLKVIAANVRGPVHEVRKILNDTNPDYTVTFGDEKFTGLADKISFKNLDFSYTGHKKVLEGVCLEINKGDMTAIVGPTGSGKSTIINLIMRYYECNKNQLFLDGKDIRSFDKESLMRHISVISQESFLFNATLKDNLLYGLDRDVSEEELAEALTKARLTNVVEKLPLGLESTLGDRGVQLSGGEKQRVSIARAFLKGADILILDEATSALDSKTEELIQEAINSLIVGKTCIVIAHRLSTIKMADKIVFMDQGKIVEEGTVSGLLESKGRFYELWNTQKFSQD